MVLPARRRPDGGHLAETRGEGQVAQDAEEEAVEEGDGAARGQDEAD